MSLCAAICASNCHDSHNKKAIVLESVDNSFTRTSNILFFLHRWKTKVTKLVNCGTCIGCVTVNIIFVTV